MKRYDRYKPSGFEWIGEIPEHWEEYKLKRVAEINPSKSASSYDSNSEDLVTFLPMERVYEDGKFDSSIKKPIREVWTGFTYFEEDDVIIAKITPCFENGKGALLSDLGSAVGFGSTEFHVLRAKHRINKEFLYYISITKLFRNLGEALMYGAAGQKRVPTSFLEEFSLAVPPKNEQIVITSYLGRKTAEIDELIAKKRRLIDLLNEEKTAVISQAVTKGLNPSIPLKDSGIPWLGKVPAHWEVRRLKYFVSKVGSGITPRGGASVYQTSGIPLLRSQNIHFDGFNLENLAYVTEEIDEEMRNSRIEQGDVLLNITGASIGRCFFVDGGMTIGNVNQHVCIIRPIVSQLNTEFLYFSLRSGIGQLQIEYSTSGANREGLTSEQIKGFVFPIPGVDEQVNIIDFLQNDLRRITLLQTKIVREMELLQEYRTALISEAVTGKIDVRGFH